MRSGPSLSRLILALTILLGVCTLATLPVSSAPPAYLLENEAAFVSPTLSLNTAFIFADNAFANDAQFARRTGTNGAQLYSGYQFTIPPDAVVEGIEVRVDAWRSVGSCTPSFNVSLSWDTGTNFSSAINTGTVGSADPDGALVLGSPANLWGHAWTAAELNNGLVVRVQTVSLSVNCQTALDWIPIRVHYASPTPVSPPTPVPEATTTHTPTSFIAATDTPVPPDTTVPTPPPTFTALATDTPEPLFTAAVTPTEIEPPAPTVSPLPSETSTPTEQPSETHTPTGAVLPTETPTTSAAPTETPTETSTVLPAATPTETQTSTVTTTLTNTPDPTLIPTETASVTPSASPLPILTPATPTELPTPTETSIPPPAETILPPPAPCHQPGLWGGGKQRLGLCE